MGKLLDNLKRQKKDADHKKDAVDCIKLYDWLKSTDKDGWVLSSRWTPLVNTTYLGCYPNNTIIHKPSVMGYAVLKGIEE